MRLKVGLHKIGLLLGITALLLAVRPLLRTDAVASEVPNRFVKISDSVASHTNVNYNIGFETSVATTLGSVEVEFCSNDPFPGTSCTVPVGFNVSSAVLVTQTGTNDFSIDAGNTNAHKIVFSRVAGPVGTIPFSFELSGVANPSNTGTSYARIRLFSASGTGGSINEQGGLAMTINGDLTVSTEVPPHVDLCVGVVITSLDCSTTVGDSINLGVLSTATVKYGTSQFMAATNAANGYSVTVSGTSLTSGNNVLKALSTLSTSIPGTNQFGMNLRQNVAPLAGQEPAGSGSASVLGNYAIADNYTFNNGDVIVSATAPEDYKKFTATYIANIDKNQPAGFYATTITYIVLGNF